MEIGPILRALWHNKLGAMLIAVQIAFTMTVIINAIFIINERSRLMARPSGLEEANLFHLTSVGYGDNFNEQVTIDDDLNMLRQLPGVVNATAINAIPVSGSGSSTGVRIDMDDRTANVGTAIYRVDEQVFDTLGLDFIAGDGFDVTDMRYRSSAGTTDADKVVMTEALAAILFPDLTPNEVIGETLYTDQVTALQIVGIVERLQAPWPSWENVESSVLIPEQFLDTFSLYMVRTEPGQRDRVMREAEELLANSGANRVIRGLSSLEQTRSESYRTDSALSSILKTVVVTLVFINSMGIVGLAVFSINKRRKQIGTRRALGASKFEILRYFLLENLLITSVGVLVGAVLTIALSIVLTTNFNMPAMAWYYAPLGALALIVIGQLAALGPSARATTITPATATRSV